MNEEFNEKDSPQKTTRGYIGREQKTALLAIAGDY